MKIAVFGATGKTGRYLVERLCADGHEVHAFGRNTEKLNRLDPRALRIVADLENPPTLHGRLNAVDCVVSLAHARFTENLLTAIPQECPRIVLTGSTRKFTRLPDPAADAVRKGEAAFLASGRPGVMLHPTMIYGAPDERNVNRILRLARGWPRFVPLILPLPDGGRNVLQPIFVDDMVEALAAATSQVRAFGPPIIVAGPEPITYADMVRACACAMGRKARVVGVPVKWLAAIARLAARWGIRLPFDAAEFARAGEDKRFDISDMQTRLGVNPRPFADGLRLKVERGWM